MSEAIVEGGHAIMLKVVIPEEVKETARDWVKVNPGEIKFDNAHVTLAFAGRNMTATKGEVLVKAAQEIIPHIPPNVSPTGAFALFGKNRDHLVALLKSENLELPRLRLDTLMRAGNAGTASAGFRPHATLIIATGEQKHTVPRAKIRVPYFAVTELIVKLGSRYQTIWELQC